MSLPLSPKPLPKIHAKPSFEHWGNLLGCAIPMTLAALARQQSLMLMVVTSDPATALRLERELKCFANDDGLDILHFPDWETLPYDNFSPHQDIISQRLKILERLGRVQKGILVVPVSTLMHRLVPKRYVGQHSFQLQKGQSLALEPFRVQLIENGYRLVSQVMEHGEFAIRGAILDVFPMGLDTPIRIDLLMDEVDSIRTFDPETQRSLDVIPHVALLPGREYPLTSEAIQQFRSNWRSAFAGDTKAPIYQHISKGSSAAGIEYYLPLFFESTNTLFDYLPTHTVIVRLPHIESAATHFFEEIEQRFEDRRYDLERPLIPPATLFLAKEELFHQFKQFSRLEFHEETLPSKMGHSNFAIKALPDLSLDPRTDKPFAKIINYMEQQHCRVLFCAESAGRRELLLELLQRHQIEPTVVGSVDLFLAIDNPFGLMIAGLDHGVHFLESDLILITEGQLFGQTVLQRRRRKPKDTLDYAVNHLAELKIGEAVVHLDHGVGRYAGLITLTLNDVSNEFVMLAYANNDKLYVPVSNLQSLSRYSAGDSTEAPLNKLGTDHWEKAKRKALERARDVAAELLDIYARRAAHPGTSFAAPNEHYYAFSNSFAFEPTLDQLKAIEAVEQDMQQAKPMDRVICGDVGFGKTEVAMRAAFLAVQNSKQVAVLVPTTLLAQQHFDTFKDRFADWPIHVNMISRFKTKSEQEAIIQEVERASIDILIGTHKLLSSGLKFKDLGLVIIDEEHRFGVEHKEKLKALRSDVNILTLTATPIPRTLNMALSSIRDLSIIATPPAKRLSIKTFVREYHSPLIREAILRELLRGGQVYYLHNAVETIEKTAEKLATLIPEAKISIAHGQMPKRQLERVMSDFYHQRTNVLVCTTIIETGIDVPTANTMIIERADKLGLAQLHQLRGRVGRSHHQAYAYLLTLPEAKVAGNAEKRLQAISAFEDLGAGFVLASQDLEIRGAGELLGDEQSGNIEAIGYSLYMELLDRTVKALQSGKNISELKTFKSASEINLQLSALIPEDYLPDTHSRLVLYKRIANAATPQELEELQAEMIDRFGTLPPATKNLFKVSLLGLEATRLGIRKLEAHAQGGRIEFLQDTMVDPLTIISLVQKQPTIYQFQAPNLLRFKQDLKEIETRFKACEALLALLVE